ncbi:MAG: HigA family addiction module antidote protein [Rickettsiales bacterium]|jgi:addiction module HigA family antidote|nr:HigA family addiction module antidote protein [Rickettsiales bacterium]
MKKYIENITIGEFLITEFLEPLGLSQNALARAINVPQNRINEIANGKRGITADTDLRLCRYFNMSDGFFLRVQTKIDQDIARQKLENELNQIIPYANDNGHRDLIAM